MDWQPLIDRALECRARAHAPYSGFLVGAAILMSDGSIHGGCNVENRVLGLTVCAERVALGAAIAAGAGTPVAVAVVTDTNPPAAPCGQCRDSLAEFNENVAILLTNLAGERRELTLADLLPSPFHLPETGE